MGCDSWVFVHKHISDAEDGNGRVIERKVLWNYSSWEIGEMFTVSLALPNGTYRSTCSEDLLEFAGNCLDKIDPEEHSLMHSAFVDMVDLLQDTDPRDNFFVSVDW
jgi:hypothetical protein